jgi:hypothetical protein
MVDTSNSCTGGKTGRGANIEPHADEEIVYEYFKHLKVATLESKDKITEQTHRVSSC